MAKKVSCILFSLLLLLLSGCAPVAQPKKSTEEDALSGNITVDYEMTDDAIINPYMGFAVDATSKAAAEVYSLVYIDITFRELQPDDSDHFDFEGIAAENNIELWKSQGKHAVLRFVCDIPGDSAHMDIPDWLYEMTGDGTIYDTSYGRGYSPNYNNETFIQYHKSAIRALGEYFSDGFVAYVQLGSLGHWGEWHVKREDGIVGMPESDVRNEYVSHYVEAFKNAKIMMRRPFSSAKKYGLGLYNDMAGDPVATEEWLDWIENGGEYTQTGEVDGLVPMGDFWKSAPVGGELTSSLTMEYLCGEGLWETVSLLRQSHTTFIGPKCPVSSSDKYDGPLYENAVSEIIKEIGYRIGITGVAISSSYDHTSQQIEIEWKNEGAAPLYFDLPVKLYLVDDSGAQEELAAVDINLTELLPDMTMRTVTDIPTKPDFSQKMLCVGITDPITWEPVIQLASNQEKVDHNLFLLCVFP